MLTGIITTIVGSSTSCNFGGDNGAATSAFLCSPSGVGLDSSGRVIGYRAVIKFSFL